MADPLARAIDALPLLNAIVLETYRLYPAIAGAKACRKPFSKNARLGVHGNIFSGIRVAARVLSLHMNPVVYTQPDTWEPERWLNATPSQLAEMNRWLWVFRSDGGTCIKSHFTTHDKRANHPVYFHSLLSFISYAFFSLLFFNFEQAHRSIILIEVKSGFVHISTSRSS